MHFKIDIGRDNKQKEATPAQAPKMAPSVKAYTLPSYTPQVHRAIMEGVSIRNLQQGKITEADIGLALTSPVLGQYVSAFAWADDWAYYWEYLDTYLLVPEAAFALDKKNELIWKRGFEIQTKNEAAKAKFLKLWKELRLGEAMRSLTFNALMYGNGYCETVDNSKAVWTGQANAIGYNSGGANTALTYFKQATELYGLKNLDPRTMRKLVDPGRFDTQLHEPYCERYIQRFWTGTGKRDLQATVNSSNEYNFHPDQIIHLKFNDIGGTYGYSLFRKAYFTIKGYLLMLQYLPQIVQKRADPGLQFKYGGAVKDPNTPGGEVTVLAGDSNGLSQDFEQWKASLMYKNPGEDLYTDILTSIEQIYKNEGQIRGIAEIIQLWKERVFIGVNMPTSLTDPLGRAQGEIKWGDLKFEMLENEVLGYQQRVEEILLRLYRRLCPEDPDGEVHFNPVTPDDWRGDTEPLVRLYTAKIINKSYVLQRLKMPTEAGDGCPEVYGQGDQNTEDDEDDTDDTDDKDGKEKPQPKETFIIHRMSQRKASS